MQTIAHFYHLICFKSYNNIKDIIVFLAKVKTKIIMKKIYTTLLAFLAITLIGCSDSSTNPVTPEQPEVKPTVSQGWPENYGGVMLQGFSWDSYDNSQWKILAAQANDFKGYIDLVWVPQSGKCLESNQVMGYTPYYFFNQNSSFGSESELRSMIQEFKANNIGTIADIVINHHNTDGWFGFPKEEYKGETYQLQSTDVCANDDGGKTATEAKSEGVSLSKNNDEGEDWGGMRDLDHKSENTQKIVKAYLNFLKNDLGYVGFRYDMVKGYAGSHVTDYNDATGIEYSVGEYWDSNEKITSWINATNKKSAAFDFQFRYNVRDAIKESDWSKLNSTYNLMHDASLRRYAVTFVENHDMQVRLNAGDYKDDAIKKDTLAANAYMLAMPGTPCIFQPHWMAYESELKAMIAARKAAGITNMSNYTNKKSQKTLYVNEVTGSKAKLLVAVGNDAAKYQGEDGYTKILSGYHYAYFLSNNAETPYINKASGTYEEAFKAVLTAVSNDANAKLVYTIDGSEPTTKSTTVESGKEIAINGSCTLKVGLLVNGEVKNVMSNEYIIQKFKAYKIKVYVNVDNVNWNPVYFYSWCDNNKQNASSKWPGDKMTETETKDGKTWYWKEYSINSPKDLVNFVFNNGNGTQTVDKTGITHTTYFEISSEKEGDKYTVKDVTSTYSNSK